MSKFIFQDDLHGDSDKSFHTRMYVSFALWYGNSGWVVDTSFRELSEDYSDDDDEAFKKVMAQVFDIHDTIFPKHRLDDETGSRKLFFFRVLE